VDDPVRVTATTTDGARVWIGRTTPSDARAVVGGAAHTSITGTRVRSWSLDRSRSGTGTPGGDLGGADVWRQTVTGTGRATVEVDQGDAPEALVVAADGGRGTVTSVTVTIARGTWFAQALLTTLVGLILAAVGLVGLVGSLRRRAGAGSTPADAARSDSTTAEAAASDSPTPTPPRR
jgi:hypothetical protein